MTGKAKISFLILVWSIVAIQIFVNDRQRERLEKGVATAFSVTEDSVLRETIRGYGKFGDVDLTTANKKKMLENLALKLGITDGYSYSAATGEDYTKTILTKKGANATTVLQMVSLKQEEREAAQYIVLQIETEQKVTSAISLFKKVKRLYKEIGMEPQVSLEIETEQEGNAVTTQPEGVVGEFLTGIKGKQVDAISENGICTVYGYTKLEDDYLVLNGKKVNVQIVMSYDETKDKTYVKVGMPIVNSSY